MCGGQIASSPIDVLAMLPAGHSAVLGCGGPAARFPVGQPVVAAVAVCVAAWPAAVERVAAVTAEHVAAVTAEHVAAVTAQHVAAAAAEHVAAVTAERVAAAAA